MSVKRDFIGETPQGAPVYEYRIQNSNGMEVSVMNYGAVVRSIIVTDKEGRMRDVCLGFEDYSEYFINDGSLGATIGPVANRTKGAAFTIDGHRYTLKANEGENNLHSDFDASFYKKVWDAAETENGVKFTINAEDGELGFPGNRIASVEFILSDKNELSLHYHAVSDKNTVFNLTNHTYFNLGGHDSGNVLQHILQMNTSKYTVIGAGTIPTGEIASVKGTPLDFTRPKAIGCDIRSDNDQMKLAGGYDHNFCIDDADGTLRNFANISNPATGLTMRCFTTLPGVQFYTANFLNTDKGKEGVHYKANDGFCLETQFYPNSINTPGFPDTVFGPGRDYDSTTMYQFI